MLAELGVLEGIDENMYPELGSFPPDTVLVSMFPPRHNCIVLKISFI